MRREKKGMHLCVFEDNAVGRLQPLTDTRPAFDLRCGVRTLLERQLHAFGAERAFAFVRPELADLCRLGHPELTVNSLDGWQEGAYPRYQRPLASPPEFPSGAEKRRSWSL